MSTLYVLKEGQKRGPFTTDELEAKVVAGEFASEDLYWTEGMEDWLPLSTIIQVVTEADSAEVETPTTVEPDENAVELYDSDTIRVTTSEVELSDVLIPISGIAKVTPQIETMHRIKPLLGCVILGVLIICLILVEIPRSTVTHWVIWGAVLAGLSLWWLRCLYSALRTARSLLVIDLTDGDEHVVRLSPEEVTLSSQAIEQARLAALAH